MLGVLSNVDLLINLQLDMISLCAKCLACVTKVRIVHISTELTIEGSHS